MLRFYLSRTVASACHNAAQNVHSHYKSLEHPGIELTVKVHVQTNCPAPLGARNVYIYGDCGGYD